MEIKHLLFDMDNTLYPSSSQMDSGITLRMLECVSDFFNCSIEEAKKLKEENIVHYSTTLEWLRMSGMKDVEGFLTHVHPDNEADELQPQPGLREFLISLDYPKSVLTNAPYEHAERVLNKFGIADLFVAVTDIRDCEFYGKPYPKAYETALKKAGASMESTVFFDDMTKYVDGWTKLGGTAVLVGDKNGRPLSCEAAVTKIAGNAKEGRLFKMKDIYETKKLLEELGKL